jgi:hypothetical protein
MTHKRTGGHLNTALYFNSGKLISSVQQNMKWYLSTLLTALDKASLVLGIRKLLIRFMGRVYM